MKLTLKDIINDDFLSGIRKVGKSNLPMRTAFKLKDITNKVDDETQKYRDLVKDLFDKYAKKDKNGNFKQKVQNGVLSVELKDEEKFNSAHNELLDIEVELPTVEVKFEEVEDIKITPNEIYVVSKVIDFVE